MISAGWFQFAKLCRALISLCVLCGFGLYAQTAQGAQSASLSPAISASASASDLPAAIQTLLNAKKYDDAARALAALIDESSEKDRLPLIRQLLTIDPDVQRLVLFLDKSLEKAHDPQLRTLLVKNLGQLQVLLRNFNEAAAVYDLGGPVAKFQLASGRLHLFLGNVTEARTRLVAALGGNDKLVSEAAACALSWLSWSQGDAKKAYEIVKNQTSPAGLTLQCLSARSLGQSKDELAALERLRTNWPHSVWFALVDNDNDPSIQMDALLMVLTGIGPAASGSIRPASNTDKVAESSKTTKSGKSAKDDNTTPKGIQVGIFKSAANANKLAEKLKGKGFMTLVEEDKGSPSLWKVTVLVRPGQDSQTLVVQLKDIGIEGFLIF